MTEGIETLGWRNLLNSGDRLLKAERLKDKQNIYGASVGQGGLCLKEKKKKNGTTLLERSKQIFKARRAQNPEG